MVEASAVPLQPAMSDAEVGVVRECFSKAASLVEFGSGGSTVLAAGSRSLRRIWSVESDPRWVARLREDAGIVAAEREGRLNLQAVDIGVVRDYGYPLDDSRCTEWPHYYESVWDNPAACEADLVLIDGRFRVACALEAVARCPPHTVLLFHDFWNRTPYHPVLAFTDWLGSCDSLAILRRKPSFDQAKFDAVRQAYRLQPD